MPRADPPGRHPVCGPVGPRRRVCQL